MRAAVIENHGEIDDIQVQSDLPVPEPGPEEVLLNVRAAALNHLDLFVLQGVPGVDLSFPHVLGSDAAGVVEDTGNQVDRVQNGDRVLVNAGMSCGNCEFCRAGEESLCEEFHLLGEHVDGTYAEYVTVPAKNVAKVPDGFSFTEAAAFPLVFMTAWRMLVTRAELSAGESVLIHGVGGGVSSAALMIATEFGGDCIVTSSSDQKLERAFELDATVGVNYTKEDVVDRVYEETGGRGVDVVVDNVGKETWEVSQKAASNGGRIVTCGATTGFDPDTNVNRIFWKQLSILGSTMGSHEDFDRMLSWVKSSDTHPVIDSTYPLEEVREAERRLSNAEQFGKIVLSIGEQ